MRRVRNWIRYIVVIVLNVFFMIVFHSYVNLLLLVGLLLLPVYSIWGLKQVQEALSLQIFVPEEPMEKGNEFLLRFVMDNPTWFPLINATLRLKVENRFYQEEGMHSLNLPVHARRKTEASYSIWMDYSGRFVVSVERIELMDLLGICEAVLPVAVQKECVVFPSGASQDQEAGRIYMIGVSEAMESRQKGYDFSDVSGIREYIPGDKLQNIHWKLSMKKDDLMVKERISVSAMQLNVLVELANDEEMRLESVLELADGVTRSLVAQNLPFTVFYYSTNLGSLRDCYIGNEVERQQWLEMVLYDRSYPDFGRVEDMFLQQNPSATSYLYIGYDQTQQEAGHVIFGEQQTIAALRG